MKLLYIFIFVLSSNFVIVVSVCELSSVRYTRMHQTFKHIKFSTVEFIAELIEIVLQEFRFDVVEYVKQQTLRVADDNMYPRKHFRNHLWFNHLTHM